MPATARMRLVALLGGLLLLALLLARQPPAAVPVAPPLILLGEPGEGRDRPTPLTWAEQVIRPPRVDPGGSPPGALARVGSTRFHHRDLVLRLAISPDGRTLYIGTAEHDALYAWDADTGRLRWRVTFADPDPADPRPRERLDPRDIGFVGHQPAVLLPDSEGRACVVRFDPAGGAEAARVRLDPPTGAGEYRFSRDGTRVAVGRDRALAVYDTATGRRLFGQRTGFEVSGLDGLDFSPDGSTLAVGDYNGGVHLFEVATGRPLLDAATGYDSCPIGLRFALGGEVVVARPMTTDWNPVLLLDAATGAVRHRLRAAGGEWAMWSSALSPDGRLLNTACRVYPEGGGRRDVVVTWDVATGAEVRRFPCGLPYHIAVGPDGRVLAAGGGHDTELVDAATGEELLPPSDEAGGYAQLLAAPGGGWVGLAWDGVDTLDPAGRRLARFAPPADGATWWGSLSPDGRRLVRARGAVKGERCGPAEVWDVRTGRMLAAFGREENPDLAPGFEHEGHDVRGFSPDGSVVYTTRGTGRPAVHAWDLANGRPVAPPAWWGSDVWDPAFSPDGRWAAVRRAVKNHYVGRQQATEVVVVDVASGGTVAVLKCVDPPRIQAVAFSPDGRLVAVAPDHDTDITNHRAPVSDTLVYLFEVPSGREVGRLRGPDGSARLVAFSPDGRSVATAGVGRTARVWEVATLGTRASFPHGRLPRTLLFSADSRALAADGDDAPVYVWDLRGGAERPQAFPTAEALERAWAGLADPDARSGLAAVRLLAASPEDSLRFLRTRPAPAGLQAVRAVEAVEWIGTPDAVKLLEAWAGGPAGSRLTDEARTALSRIRTR